MRRFLVGEKITVTVDEDLSIWSAGTVEFALRPVMYLDGELIASIGEPPTDGRFTAKVDCFAAPPDVEVLARFLLFGITQIIGTGLRAKPVLHVIPRGVVGPELQSALQRAGALAGAHSVEFAEPQHDTERGRSQDAR